MTGEVRFIGGDTFDSDDALWLHFHDAINEKERVTVGQNFADLVYIQYCHAECVLSHASLCDLCYSPAMGAWDTTVFGNDAAADWAEDLLEAPKPSAFVESTLAKAKADYLEAGDASEIVAAAAVIAAARGHAPADLSANRGTISGLAPAALKALERARNDSELQELLQERGEYPAWCVHLDGIAAGLRG
jgi:hypothetical protein